MVDFDQLELRNLVADLTETMLDAPGVGLAAPQIGVGLRVFTYHVDNEPGHLVNPCAEAPRGERGGRRGLPVAARACSSPPPRAPSRSRQGFNMNGDPVTIEGTELLARCVQHETDHLDGILFIDRLDKKQAEGWR